MLGAVRSVLGALCSIVVAALSSVVRAFGVRNVVIVGAAAVALVAGIVFLAPSFSPKNSEAVDLSVSGASDGEEGIDVSSIQLPESLDPEVADALMAAAAEDWDVAWIAQHVDSYAADGEDAQQALLELAATEPAAVPFVRAFPERYPESEGSALEEEVKAGEVPLLYQWDERWGYTEYASGAFALTGCYPTALAMAYMGVTGDASLTPYDMGQRAQQGGYETESGGTDSSFLVDEAPSLGLACQSVNVDADSLTAALQDGAVVICRVGPGDFADGDHCLVIAGLTEDGQLVVHDPSSAVRSEQAWDVAAVVGQAKALWAYAAG